MKKKYHIYDSYGAYITTKNSYKEAWEFVYSNGGYGTWTVRESQFMT